MRFPMGLETVVTDGRTFVALRAFDPVLNKWASPSPLRARPLARCRVLAEMQRLGLAKVDALLEEQAQAQDAEDGKDGAGQEDEVDNPAAMLGLAFAPPPKARPRRIKARVAQFSFLPKTLVLELGNWRYHALLPVRKDAAATMEATSANFAFLFSLLREELAASTPASASFRKRKPAKARLHACGYYVVDRPDLPPRQKRAIRTVYERLALCRPPPASAKAPRERAQLYFKSSADACTFAAAPADEAAKIVEARDAAKACKRARPKARAKTARKAARQDEDEDFAGAAWGEDEEAACAEEAAGGEFEALSWEGAAGVEEAACLDGSSAP